MVAGAATGVGYQATEDAWRGELSSVSQYATVATTGAVLGYAGTKLAGIQNVVGNAGVREGTQRLAGAARVQAASLKQKVLQIPKMSGEVKNGIVKAGQGLIDIGNSALKPLANEVGSVGPGTGKLIQQKAAIKNAINPRVTNRLQKWREYQASGRQMDMRSWVKATQRNYGGVSGGYKSGFSQWSRRISKIQDHHLITRKMATALESRGLTGFQMRGRKDLIYRSAPGGHVGYETWHRTMDDVMLRFIQRTPNLNEERLLRYVHRYYQQPDVANHIPSVDLGF